MNHPGLDAVSIATFDQQHARQVRKALLAGKHGFVEKPLCRTEKELKTIRKAWAREKPALMANLVLRAAPLYCALRRMIAAGKLGEIYAMDGHYHLKFLQTSQQKFPFQYEN